MFGIVMVVMAILCSGHPYADIHLLDGVVGLFHLFLHHFVQLLHLVMYQLVNMLVVFSAMFRQMLS